MPKMITAGVFYWLCIILGVSLRIPFTSSKEVRVVCYYTNWSVYRPGTAKFSPQNINPYLCTHLIYAFGGFTKENNLKPFDKYQDIEKGGYAKFTGLKTYNKNLKTLLAIGGWNEASSRFSPMVASPDRRRQLVKNSIKFLRQNHFDGLDLDWEYPAFREGSKSKDRENYAELVQELREEFDRESEKTGRPRLLLTMAVPAGIEYINKGYDVPKLTKYLDWMNILSYDYHSAFEPAVNHHAPLLPLQEATEYDYDVELNIDYTIKHYLELGADPSKLVMGIPTYGRSYTLFNPDANAIGDPADGPGEMGEATREDGYLAYYEICENVKSNDWTVVQPNDKAMGPYAFKGNQWVGYDDENIVKKKAKYIAENNLGGIMFWAIDNDDFRGNCHDRPYPLIEAAKEALISAYGITEENLISPPVKPTKLRNKQITRAKVTVEENSDTTTRSSKPRRRNRTKPKTTSKPTQTEEKSKISRESTSHSSLKVITPAYTTPEPPSTPDQGGAFKCEDEGFFPHPKDCKRYFWCLSGPGELGIVAHQFTCPAGLYFNKAADSCDYTQNVLCNKKLSKTSKTSKNKETTEKSTTTSTTTTTTTQKSTIRSSIYRVPPRKSTTTTTTTTEDPYLDEYEYEDEDEIEDTKTDSEEDPKVIKELLNLIKKAGGIEELEKQINFGHDKTNGATTPSTKTKSIVEKLLTRNISAKERKSIANNNRRGPQNEGLDENTEQKNTNKKVDRKPHYTNILRRTTSKPEDEEITSDEPESSISRYSNIRKNEESNKPEATPNRNTNSNTTPTYVNIRRQKPTTTGTTTTTSTPKEDNSVTKYVSIRRTTTTEATKENQEDVSTSKNQEVSSTSKLKVNLNDSSLSSNGNKEDSAQISTESVQPSSTHEISTISSKNESDNKTEDTTALNKSRIFINNSTVSTTHKPSRYTVPTSTTKVSDITYGIRSRGKPKVNDDINSEKTAVYDKYSELEQNKFPSTKRRKPIKEEVSTSTTSPRRRLRPVTVPKIPTESEEDLSQRKFRPTHLLDFSSLTAADISVPERKRGESHRRTSIAASSTEKYKILNRNSFNKEDQIKSDTFEIPITRQNRRNLTSENSETIRKQPQRTRKLIRRLKNSTQRPNLVTESSFSSRNFDVTTSFRRLRRPIPKNLNSGEESNSSEEIFEEDENIRLSASNIRENSNSNRDNGLFDRKYEEKTRKTYIPDKSEYIILKPSTESYLSRTRTLARKLTPTEESNVDSDPIKSSVDNLEAPINRTRKIIRRLRPLTRNSLADRGKSHFSLDEDDSSKHTSNVELKEENHTTDSLLRGRKKYVDIVRSSTSPFIDKNSPVTPSVEQYSSSETLGYTDFETTFTEEQTEGTTFEDLTTVPKIVVTNFVEDLTTYIPSSTVEPVTFQNSRTFSPTYEYRSTPKFERLTTSKIDEKTQKVTTNVPKLNHRRLIYRPRTTTTTTTTQVSTLSDISNRFAETTSNKPHKTRLRPLTKTRHFTSSTTESYHRGTTKNSRRTTTSYNVPFDSTSSTESNSSHKQKLRNKLLFTRKRKPNYPLHSTTETKQEQTTEHLTTLYHVFAEPETNENESISKNNTNNSNPESKIERIVEINRIIEVHERDNKNEEKTNETSILDKIGTITRKTSINVVDGKEIDQQGNQRLAVVQDIIKQETNNEIYPSTNREEKKIRTFPIDDPFNNIENKAQGAEIIDGISHIKVITPRPLLPVEVSTIALEALFRKDMNESTDDKETSELLDTEHSRFVNIKVLKPEDGRSLWDYEPAETPKVIKIIPNDEVITNAKVVEIPSKDMIQNIKIVPIEISMARTITGDPIIGLNKLNEKIGNSPYRPTV